MADSEVKALIFDVFGTVVDWRSSIIKHGKDFGRIHGVEAAWAAFADAWRSKYSPYMNKVRTGELPWTNLDALHRMALEDVLGEFKITGISDEAKAKFNLAWHDLKPWPDSVPGLYRLKARHIIAPMSNGNIALMTNMAQNGGLPWDCILGAEVAKHYEQVAEALFTHRKMDQDAIQARLANSGWAVGTTSQVVEQLGALEEVGVQEFMFQHHAQENFGVLELIAKEVIPQVRK